MVSISDDLNQEGSQNENLPSYFNLLDDLFKENTSLFDTESMPDLQSVTDTDSNGEILSYYSPSSDKDLEVPNIEEESLEESFNDLKNSNDESEFIPCHEDAYVMTYEASALQGTSSELFTDVDLYDSGASCHMSGVRHCFINFITIDPKPIMATDKRSFNATGKGDLWALLPNGDEVPSCVLLKDVLYAPAMHLNSHESKLAVIIPLLILAIFSIFFGFIFSDLFVGIGITIWFISEILFITKYMTGFLESLCFIYSIIWDSIYFTYQYISTSN